MDEAQKLTALKRAYADVILNTAKEAAARVMVTERKAMRFQQELHVAKEEAFCMLLHVKQMMDSKIREAAVTSSNQQVKIDELEAQLHEAEDIVRDLREELSLVQDELEKLVASRSHLEEPRLKGYTYIVTQEQNIQENRLHSSDSIKCLSKGLQDESVIAFNHRIEAYKYQIAKESCLENQYVSMLDFASVVTMNKEPELSINGCTQRIRAFESNLSEDKQSLSHERNGVITEAVVAEDEKGEGAVVRPVLDADKSCRLQNEPDELIEVIHDDTPCSISRKTSMFQKCKRKEKDICSSHPNEVIEVCQAYLTSQVDGVEKEAIVKQEEKKSGPEPVVDEVKEVKQADNVEVMQLKRQNSLSMHQGSNHAIAMSSPNVSSSETSLDPLNNIVQCGETPQQDQESRLSSNDSAYAADLNTKLRPVVVNESTMEIVESCSTLQIANNGTTVIDKEEINGQGSGSEKHSPGVVKKMDLETEKAPLKSDLNSIEATTNVVRPQPANDRLIMYTFQRKRKKEVPSSTEKSASLEESILKKKKVEEQYVSLDLQKSGSTNESSRATRRQAQVARQLLSLSEKKWRQ